MSILGTGLWLGEGDAERLADSIAGRATVVCLKGRINEFGPSLERPAAADMVYAGRRMSMGGWRLAASDWANPFVVKTVGGAQRAVELYAEYLPTRPDLLGRLPELRGKRLACWCQSGPCHARHIAGLVNKLPAEPSGPPAVTPRRAQRLLPDWALR